MPFGLQIGTERASALQQSVQDELIKRGYSSEADPVMAEYITIMIINNKTAPQITVELQDLIGSDYEASFTEWLFTEAAKDTTDSSATTQTSAPSTSNQPEPAASEPVSSQSTEQSKRAPNAPTRGFAQAVTQANSSSSGQKRTASARSPSPNQPNKTRRTDLPTAPRAMHRDGNQHGRSLLERIGRPGGRNNNNAGPAQHAHGNDEVQRRINDIVGNPSHNGGMMHPNSMPPGMGMDMAMANPMMLQEMMMNQMAMMAHMANTMGMVNPNPQQFNGAGFPMQGMPGDMGGFQNGQGAGVHHGDRGTGRGGGRGGNMRGRGRGGVPNGQSPVPNMEAPAPVVIAAPVPQQASIAVPPIGAAKIPYVLPERPQSPSLCKFGVKCTNAQCRWSHPSPVATGESGVVLSNDACENGKNCKDADCIKAHVSPAVLKPQAAAPEPTQYVPTPAPVAPPPAANAIPCRFGTSCSRPNCTYTHPERTASNSHFSQQCRFGANCTRAACPFQHPEGRVLPSTFHRGLSTTSPVVSVPKPETGTMGGPSHHRSAVFNKNGSGSATLQSKLAQQIKEIEEKKKEVEKAEAAAGKKDETSSVPIAT